MATCPGAEHPVRAGAQAELRDGGQGGVPGSYLVLRVTCPNLSRVTCLGGAPAGVPAGAEAAVQSGAQTAVQVRCCHCMQTKWCSRKAVKYNCL